MVASFPDEFQSSHECFHKPKLHDLNYCQFSNLHFFPLDLLFAAYTDLPFALSNHLSFLPYLVLLETLKITPTNTAEGQSLRKQLLEVGVVHHTLQCLSSAGHHSPRVDSGEAEPMQMEGGRYMYVYCNTG